jgi:hypothetical protein
MGVRALAVSIVVLCCMMASLAYADGRRLAVGFGGGVDFSTYAGVGPFDLGPTLGGFIGWTGDYPRVYRLNVQWTDLHHEQRSVFEPDFGHGGSGRDDTENISLTAVQLGALWFEDAPGQFPGYAGAELGALIVKRDGNPTDWAPVLSGVLGACYRGGGWTLSIESGPEVVFSEEHAFLVLPIRLFVGR